MDALERVFLSGRPLPEQFAIELPGKRAQVSPLGREQQLVAHARVVDAFYQLDRAAARRCFAHSRRGVVAARPQRRAGKRWPPTK